jgi:hypothetical protein
MAFSVYTNYNQPSNSGMEFVDTRRKGVILKASQVQAINHPGAQRRKFLGDPGCRLNVPGAVWCDRCQHEVLQRSR